MSGRRVVATVALILFATAVVPPLGAFAVARARVRTAAAAVRGLAEAVRGDTVRAGDAARTAEVFCGAGRLPLVRAPHADGWVTAARTPLPRGAPPDPWGNCYLVNLGASRVGRAVVWALSAGPDGIIDTPFLSSSDSTLGDDVGVRVR